MEGSPGDREHVGEGFGHPGSVIKPRIEESGGGRGKSRTKRTQWWLNSLDDTLRSDASRLGVRGLMGATGCAAADVEFDRAEGPFVPLDGHAQRGQEPLGRVEVHHDSLVRLHVLAAASRTAGD